MLFFSFFKTLINKEIEVELKNSLTIKGTLQSIDQFMNLKLENVSVADVENYPHLLSVKSCFVRASVVRYVHLIHADVDTELLQDATRREYKELKTRSG
ncbi:hypothetical protein NDN08_004375 [Rhodosorus marinus]|uniref:U6 snRNA-associated Sm-like protein LSm2 n=1 Tax=Rhodosorus marinus TaxID=101924 RepID=A0AAV8URP5_9RHOD|nr:hypothetical protein NDN08_004375 [Rhodosorus marinus]